MSKHLSIYIAHEWSDLNLRNDVECIFFSFSKFLYLNNFPEASVSEPSQRLVIAGIAYWRSTNVRVSVVSLVVEVIASLVSKPLIGLLHLRSKGMTL